MNRTNRSDPTKGQFGPSTFSFICGSLFVFLPSLQLQAADLAATNAVHPPQPSQPTNSLLLKRSAFADSLSGYATAGSILVPDGWQLSANTTWTQDPLNLVSPLVSVAAPSGTPALTIYPTASFFAPDHATAHQTSNSFGLEARDLVSPAAYLRLFLIPRFRNAASPAGKSLVEARGVRSRAAPEFARIMLSVYGYGTDVQAVKVRFEYDTDSIPVEEDVFCSIASSSSRSNSVWRANAVSFRAERGKLDYDMSLLTPILHSLRFNSNWLRAAQETATSLEQCGVRQSDAWLRTNMLFHLRESAPSARVDDRSRRKQALLQQGVLEFSQIIRGIDLYQSSTGDRLLLPDNFAQYYSNDVGDVFLQNSQSINTPPSSWQKLDKLGQ